MIDQTNYWHHHLQSDERDAGSVAIFTNPQIFPSFGEDYQELC
jgi:hypothetical protein